MKGKKLVIGWAAAFTVAFGSLVITGSAFAASPEKVLYSFCDAPNCADGEQSWASLIFDSAGNLYGTTAVGGSSQCGGPGCGTVFELSAGADGKWTQKVLYRFCSTENCADGANPYAGLIFDSDGNLYGTTGAGGSSECTFGYVAGCGTVFELTLRHDGTWSEKALYKFCSTTNCADGKSPYAGLIFDSAGNLFGTTYSGGSSDCQGCGTVFELTPEDNGKWTEKVLHRFTFDSATHDGASPGYGSLIFDKTGNLYGTTYYGGRCLQSGGCGTVFQLTRHAKGQWTEKVLYRFQANGTDGHNPYYGLVFDAARNLYGTTFQGGHSSKCHAGCGTVFELTPGTNSRWSEKVLYSFDGKDGTGAIDNLVLDSKGNLYGNANAGGTYNRGTVFQLSPVAGGKWKEQLYSFKPGEDGDFPSGGLIFDSAGNLYGTTFAGGAHNGGMVYKFIP
jgi:uncharacterized repeat protein (TIGR03803 family)